MEAFSSSTEVVARIKQVRRLAWELLEACDDADLGQICDDVEKLVYGLDRVKKAAKKQESDPCFGRGIDIHRDEFDQLAEDCEANLRNLEEFLSDYMSPQRGHTNNQSALAVISERLGSHAVEFKGFPKRVRTTALRTMKEQLDTFIEDIVSGRKHYYVLARIVNWDALQDEVLTNPIGSVQQIDAGQDRGRVLGRLEIQDTPVAEYHSPSRSPITPFDLPTPSQQSPSQPKKPYRAPTVEDYTEGEDEICMSPPKFAASPVDSPMASPPNYPVDGQRPNSSGTENASTPVPAIKGSVGFSTDIPDEDDDPMRDSKRKLQKRDTELLRLEQHKFDIKEEIRKYEEDIKAYEEKLQAWDAEELRKFRDYRDFHGTARGERKLLGEWRHVLRNSQGSTTFFVMPSGTVYHRSNDLPPKISGDSHSSFSPTSARPGIAPRRESVFSPPTRSSTRDFAQQPVFESPLSASFKSASSLYESEQREGRPWVQTDIPRSMSPERMYPPAVRKEKLRVTLEELFFGTTIKVPIRRTVTDALGRVTVQSDILDVLVLKGMTPGMKITFTGAGDQSPGFAQDIHFVLDQMPHLNFKRSGADLYTKVDITLADALTGWTKTFKTISGKKMRVSGPRDTQPSWTHRFPKHGMPIHEDPWNRGDLIVGVNILEPEHNGVY